MLFDVISSRISHSFFYLDLKLMFMTIQMGNYHFLILLGA